MKEMERISTAAKLHLNGNCHILLSLNLKNIKEQEIKEIYNLFQYVSGRDSLSCW